MFSALSRSPSRSEVLPSAMPLKRKPIIPVATTIPTQERESFARYLAVSESIELNSPVTRIEAFKIFLEDVGITVYPLKTVVPYMDEKAKTEGNGFSWSWYPLRVQDHMAHFQFGLAPDKRFNIIGSDCYVWNGIDNIYSRSVPLHALLKVQKIEADFPHKQAVHFFVCDYATERDAQPDPFLMACIPNKRLNEGDGRFVIDFWEEPGFGLEQQLGLSG